MEYAAYLGQRPHAGGKVVAKTDIQIQLPDGCYGRVAPRSGLAANHHIDVGGINQNGYLFLREICDGKTFFSCICVV